MDHISPADVFPHMRVVLGTVVGLGIARLLITVAGIVQHPHRARPSTLHLLWVLSLLIELLLFWWWQFALFRIEQWNFGIALFLFSYAIVMFMLAALLSPDRLEDYNGYQDFFLKRRGWFFGLFAVVAIFDAIDTYMKGPEHWGRFGEGYFLQAPIGLLICLIAWRSSKPSVHLAIVCIHLLYQAFMMSRFYYSS